MRKEEEEKSKGNWQDFCTNIRAISGCGARDCRIWSIPDNQRLTFLPNPCNFVGYQA